MDFRSRGLRILCKPGLSDFPSLVSTFLLWARLSPLAAKMEMNQPAFFFLLVVPEISFLELEGLQIQGFKKMASDRARSAVVFL